MDQQLQTNQQDFQQTFFPVHDIDQQPIQKPKKYCLNCALNEENGCSIGCKENKKRTESNMQHLQKLSRLLTQKLQKIAEDRNPEIKHTNCIEPSICSICIGYRLEMYQLLARLSNVRQSFSNFQLMQWPQDKSIKEYIKMFIENPVQHLWQSNNEDEKKPNQQ